MDEAAQTQFQTLLAQHWGIVLKVAYSYGRTPEDRDDLAQEIALQLWRSFSRCTGWRLMSPFRLGVATANRNRYWSPLMATRLSN